MSTDIKIDRSAAEMPIPLENSPCQYCSVTSQANGEDPIGTAVTAQQWLFIEVPMPWAKNPWAGELAELLEVFREIERQPGLWRDLRILAIAPDKTDSTAGERHVFFYKKPGGAVYEYAQRHYHLPPTQLCELVKALVITRSPEKFDAYLQPSSRALFVCTHTNYDLACGRFGTPLYRTLKKRYAKKAEGIDASVNALSVWQTTHFGGHNFAPTLIDFPVGQFWGHLTPEVLDTLVYRRGEVAELQRFYRGWSGFEIWAQVAERSLWMQQGWGWLAVPRSARIIRQDSGQLGHRLLRWVLRWVPTIRAQVLLKKLRKKLTWAEVEIRWEGGCYRARVEVSHRVVTQLKSGEDQVLREVPQYRVREIGE